MRSKKIFRALIILAVVAGNISCDQISKKIVRQSVSPWSSIMVLGNHLLITNVENSGAFLSMGDSLSRPAKNWILSIFPLAALAGAFIYALNRPRLSPLLLWGLGCIIGGGLGNIFDRIWYGSVTDFLHLRFGFLQTGIFNLADLSIMTGSALILLHYFLSSRAKSRAASQLLAEVENAAPPQDPPI